MNSESRPIDPRLLAIDDNPDNLTSLRAVLMDAIPGCTVFTARTGPEGIALARAEDPDVILLDIIMPGMNGFAVCEKLKADERLRQIPVVFLTALRTDRESRVRALEVGAEAFLSKPFDDQELLAEIRAMTRLKTANRRERLEKEDLAALVAERTRELELELVERRRAEARVLELNVDLERRVRDRTAKLESANAELNSFAFSISHDLRAPLRTLQFCSELLVDELADGRSEDIRDLAERIHNASRRMDTMIQDVLAFSRVAREDVVLVPVDLARVVNDALRHLGFTSADDGARITVEGDLPTVLGHRTTLVQVVANLIANSLKFVPSGIEPDVRIHADQRRDVVRLWISDNGIGIAPENRERIFMPFERLHGVEEYAGTGLGLAIVRKGIERLGGSVGVESNLGEGAKFWIELARGPSLGQLAVSGGDASGGVDS